MIGHTQIGDEHAEEIDVRCLDKGRSEASIGHEQQGEQDQPDNRGEVYEQLATALPPLRFATGKKKGRPRAKRGRPQ